jgi:hypothetical protein
MIEGCRASKGPRAEGICPWRLRASAGEVRSMPCLIETVARFENLKFEISHLKSRAEGISGQLSAWADSRRNSKTTGLRCLTSKTRRAGKL